MIFICDNGEKLSAHKIYFVEADEEFVREDVECLLVAVLTRHGSGHIVGSADSIHWRVGAAAWPLAEFIKPLHFLSLSTTLDLRLSTTLDLRMCEAASPGLRLMLLHRWMLLCGKVPGDFEHDLFTLKRHWAST